MNRYLLVKVETGTRSKDKSQLIIDRIIDDYLQVHFGLEADTNVGIHFDVRIRELERDVGETVFRDKEAGTRARGILDGRPGDRGLHEQATRPPGR